jgi:uncharacterized protein (DUF433 family)
MTLPDFLRSDQYGEIFLAGHRITLYHIIKDYQEGCSAETLTAAYPTLSPALVHKVISYYVKNQPEVEQYVAESRAEIALQAAAPSRGPSPADLERRLEAKRRALERVPQITPRLFP